MLVIQVYCVGRVRLAVRFRKMLTLYSTSKMKKELARSPGRFPEQNLAYVRKQRLNLHGEEAQRQRAYIVLYIRGTAY